jgi:hypothetical protein
MVHHGHRHSWGHRGGWGWGWRGWGYNPYVYPSTDRVIIAQKPEVRDDNLVDHQYLFMGIAIVLLLVIIALVYKKL